MRKRLCKTGEDENSWSWIKSLVALVPTLVFLLSRVLSGLTFYKDCLGAIQRQVQKRYHRQNSGNTEPRRDDNLEWQKWRQTEMARWEIKAVNGVKSICRLLDAEGKEKRNQAWPPAARRMLSASYELRQ